MPLPCKQLFKNIHHTYLWKFEVIHTVLVVLHGIKREINLFTLPYLWWCRQQQQNKEYNIINKLYWIKQLLRLLPTMMVLLFLLVLADSRMRTNKRHHCNKLINLISLSSFFKSLTTDRYRHQHYCCCCCCYYWFSGGGDGGGGGGGRSIHTGNWHLFFSMIIIVCCCNVLLSLFFINKYII